MIQETLSKIQRELKAPKGQFNAFGKYKYRSCEDILEAVKPLLGETILTLDDELCHIGDRYYIRATATLGFAPDAISVTAWAREEAEKKGMDAAQITGSVSSYARKYALNGLFLIDDTKDPDTQDNTKEKKQKVIESVSPPPPVSASAENPPSDEYPEFADTPLSENERIGKVTAIEVREGETNGKPWTLYGITVGTERFKTFSDTFCDLAREAKEKGLDVRISFKPGAKGNTLLGIEIDEG